MNRIPGHLRQHFYHLYAIALADLRIQPEELDMLIEFGVERGITKHELEELLLSSAPFEATVPPGKNEKIRCLYDMARLALADSILTKEEVFVLNRLAALFGLDENDTPLIIDRFLSLAKDNASIEDVMNDVESSFSELI